MEIRIPVVQEELTIEKNVVDTGRVVVRTQVSEQLQQLDVALSREEVIVERVAVNRPVDHPVKARQEGDVFIVPVHEEVLVVTRQLVLKDELHIRKLTHETHDNREVTLRQQDVSVERHAAPIPNAERGASQQQDSTRI